MIFFIEKTKPVQAQACKPEASRAWAIFFQYLCPTQLSFFCFQFFSFLLLYLCFFKKTNWENNSLNPIECISWSQINIQVIICFFFVCSMLFLSFNLKEI